MSNQNLQMDPLLFGQGIDRLVHVLVQSILHFSHILLMYHMDFYIYYQYKQLWQDNQNPRNNHRVAYNLFGLDHPPTHVDKRKCTILLCFDSYKKMVYICN